MESLESGMMEVFDGLDKEKLGNKREVSRVKGEEGVDFFIKDKQSEEELEALKFLSKSGVSEKLLMYDKEKLVLENIKGSTFSEYISELVSKHSAKVTETKPSGAQGSSKFKIAATITSSYLPEHIIFEDQEIRRIYADYVSKLVFLMLNGTLHRDIKIDNILVDSEGRTKFIDFGEVNIVDEVKESYAMTHNALHDIYKGIELLQPLNSNYGDISQKVKENENLKSLINDLYSEYKKQSVALERRPKFLKSWIENGKISEILSQIGIPNEIAPDIENRIKVLLEG